MYNTPIFKHTTYPVKLSFTPGTARSTAVGRGPTLLALFLSVLIVIFSTPPVFGHGGKNHAENAFTSLEALKKATTLYDRLLTAGKLEASWETGLEAVRISFSGAKEYVVSFQRNMGDPSTVYFFFDPNGEYVGSNFTGP